MDLYDLRKQEEKHYRPVNTINTWRKKLTEDTEVFLRSGGKITQLPAPGTIKQKCEEVPFVEAIILSGLDRSDFMAANATGRYFNIATPKPVGVSGRSYTYNKAELLVFAEQVAKLKKDQVA